MACDPSSWDCLQSNPISDVQPSPQESPFTGEVPEICKEWVEKSIIWMRDHPLGTYDAPFFYMFAFFVLYLFAECFAYWFMREWYEKQFENIILFRTTALIGMLAGVWFFYY